MPLPPARSILVSDFDGTLTREDFYQLVMDRRFPPDAPNVWQEYLDGRITHFEVMRQTFLTAEPGEAELIELTRLMHLEPDLAAELDALRAAGWDVVVVSLGCAWYIERLLREAGVELDVHASPGRIADGRLSMEWPEGSPFLSPETGIDKPAVVRTALAGGRTVAFAGDGAPDLTAALLVPPGLRFARRGRALAAELDARGESYRPFDRWAEVARSLRGASDG